MRIHQLRLSSLSAIMPMKPVLFPIILTMCVLGAYTINYGIMFDVRALLIFGLFGLFGWLAVKLRLEIAPFIIGFILGPSAEVYFVKRLESFGDLPVFIAKSWIAALLWVLILGSFVLARRDSTIQGAT